MPKPKVPTGMDLDVFLANNYDWAQEPHLYIVLQLPQSSPQLAYRNGAAGTALYKDNDQPFKSSESSQKGLQGRMTQYHNYFLPNIGKLFACLRVKKQLVALPHQRTAEGEDGEEYNIDRGNQTEVLAKEKHLHHFLDQLNLRWRKDTNKELFVPTKGVNQLVECMRKVQGLQLLLFNSNDWYEDTLYKGGIAAPTVIKNVQKRTTLNRGVQEQTMIVRMSKKGIDELRSGNPTRYARLMNLMRDAFKEDNPEAKTPAQTPKKTPAKKQTPKKTPKKTPKNQQIYVTKQTPKKTVVRMSRRQINQLKNAEGKKRQKRIAKALADLAFEGKELLPRARRR